MSHLNTTGIADVILCTLQCFNRALGAPEVVVDEAATQIVVESVQWVLDNPMRSEFDLLEAWGKSEPWETDEAARASLVRVIALDLGGEF